MYKKKFRIEKKYSAVIKKWIDEYCLGPAPDKATIRKWFTKCCQGTWAPKTKG